jgi:hypothetical protein
MLSKNVKTKIYNAIILPTVLSKYENLNFGINEKSQIAVFENRVLERTFGPKVEEISGGWRKMHNEELQNFYSSPSVLTMIKSRST